MAQIVDGTGQGHRAKVNSMNQMEVKASNLPLIQEASVNGDAYGFATDFIALSTTGAERGILYIQNTAETNLHIELLRVSSENSVKWRVRKNPTTGTLISGGTTGTPRNLNFQSGQTFTGTMLIGSDSTTLTDGDLLTQLTAGEGAQRFDFEGAIILGQNDAIAISTEIDAGTPEVGCTVFAYYAQ
jgi:hypothetical protein